MRKLSLQKKDWWYLGVIFALVSVIAWLGVALSLKYKVVEDKTYYEKKCESFALQNGNLSQGQIVFIGDSITDGFPLDDYFADLNKATYNRGIGGDTTSGVLDRLEVSLFELQPSKIVLMIGTNDVNGLVSNEKILENYRAILTRINEKLPETEIYCVSIIPQNEDLEKYSQVRVTATTEKIKTLNSAIKQMVTDEFHQTYVDLFPLVSDGNDRLRKELSGDGLHLNKYGYEIWSALIKPYLA